MAVVRHLPRRKLSKKHIAVRTEQGGAAFLNQKTGYRERMFLAEIA